MVEQVEHSEDRGEVGQAADRQHRVRWHCRARRHNTRWSTIIAIAQCTQQNAHHHPEYAKCVHPIWQDAQHKPESTSVVVAQHNPAHIILKFENAARYQNHITTLVHPGWFVDRAIYNKQDLFMYRLIKFFCPMFEIFKEHTLLAMCLHSTSSAKK